MLFPEEPWILDFRGIHYFLPLGIAVGMLLGWAEYRVLHAQVLTPDVGIKGFLELSVIMIFFVGLEEEFVFRSALQTVASEKLGRAKGLLVASLLFGFMHGGYHLTSEIIFTFSAGLVFGIPFLKTSSLPLIALAHGITYVSLFLIVPVHCELILPITTISLILGCVFAFRSRDPRLSLKSDWIRP